MSFRGKCAGMEAPAEAGDTEVLDREFCNCVRRDTGGQQGEGSCMRPTDSTNPGRAPEHTGSPGRDAI